MGLFDNIIAQQGYSSLNDFPQPLGPGLVIVPSNPNDPYDQTATIYYDGVVIGMRNEIGDVTYVPSTVLNRMLGGTTSAGGVGVSPESYALQTRELDITQQHYANVDAIDRLKEERQSLELQYDRALAEDNLALARDVERRTAANEAQQRSLEQQQLAIDSALTQAQIGANVYGTQTAGRSSLANTMLSAATAAGEAQANPWNPMGYLTNVASAGGATPYSNMTPGQYTGYSNQMAQNWQNTYGGLADTLRQGWESTFETPAGVTSALEAARPWYEDLPRYQQASQSQRALFRGLTPAQQQALAEATPEQMAYIAAVGR